MGVAVVVCCVIFFVVVSRVVVEVLDCPDVRLLKGRIVGANRLPYFEGLFVGRPGYFMEVVELLFVVVMVGLGVVTVVVEVRESLYYEKEIT